MTSRKDVCGYARLLQYPLEEIRNRSNLYRSKGVRGFDEDEIRVSPMLLGASAVLPESCDWAKASLLTRKER